MSGYVQPIPYGGAISNGGYAVPLPHAFLDPLPFSGVPISSRASSMRRANFGKTIINVPAGATPQGIQAQILALCPAGSYISSTPGAMITRSEESIVGSTEDRMSGKLAKKLDESTFYTAALCVQASSAAYASPYKDDQGKPVWLTPSQMFPVENPNEIQVKITGLDLASPIPKSPADPKHPTEFDGKEYPEVADLLAETKSHKVVMSTFLDEPTQTDMQAWVLALKGDGKGSKSRLFCIFRGTSSKKDACVDLNGFKVTRKELLARVKSKPPVDPDHKAVSMLQAWTKLSDKEMEGLAFHDGFFRQYTAIHSELRVVLKNAATALGNDYKLIVTGHSMGGALACICCFDLLASGFAKAETTQLITICRGPVGNISVANTLDGMLKLDEDARRHLHICNNNDPVPFAGSGFLYGGTAGGILWRDDGVYLQGGTLVWMGRVTGEFRDLFRKNLDYFSGLKVRWGRLWRSKALNVAEHGLTAVVSKIANTIAILHKREMLCLKDDKVLTLADDIAQGSCLYCESCCIKCCG